MSKINVLLVAPYKGLAELAGTIAARFADRLNLQTVVGDLSEGLEQARKAEEQGIDVIISRGGTSELIRRTVSLPVIDIEVSGYDYIRAIEMAKNYSGASALVGFPQITAGASSINDLLQTDINIVTINSGEEVVPALEQLQKKGYRLIIGDMITLRITREMGMNGMLLTSGEESVCHAFEEAIHICDSIQKSRGERDLFCQIGTHAPWRIAVLGQNGAWVYRNFELEALDLQEQDLTRYLDNVLQSGKQDAILSVSDGEIEVQGRRLELEDGHAAAFYLRRRPSRARYIKGVSYKNISIQSDGFLNIFQDGSRYDKTAVNAARMCSGTDQSLLILGDTGVGKSALAYSVHRNSGRKLGPFVQIDCTAVEPEGWAQMLARWEEPEALEREGTICLENVNALDQTRQSQLLELLQRQHGRKARLISTSTENIEALSWKGDFDPALYGALSEVTIYLPALRERLEELRDIASLYIISANARYGKQVVGIEEDGVALLRQLEWKGNFDQLNKLISQLVLYAQRPYIGAEDIRGLLCRSEWQRAGDEPSLEGTLEEITSRIIRAVLKEENGNLSRTAKRLGIGRSTLWRKMNQSDEGDVPVE